MHGVDVKTRHMFRHLAGETWLSDAVMNSVTEVLLANEMARLRT